MYHAHQTFLLSVILFFLTVPLYTGCGRSTVPEMRPVKGTIQLDGQPLQQAEVTFSPKSGGSAGTGWTNEKGEYQLFYAAKRPGAKIGENEVRISKVTIYQSSTNKNANAAVDPELRDYNSETGKGSKPKEIIPERYNTKSELVANVEDVKVNVIDFELDSAKNKKK